MPDTEVDVEMSDEDEVDKYVTYPMTEIVNAAYHSEETEENVNEKVTSFIGESSQSNESNDVPDRDTESAHMDRDRPALRRTKSNRDALFDKVVRQSQSEETVTEYRVTGGDTTDGPGDTEGTMVELRNKRIRVKSKWNLQEIISQKYDSHGTFVVRGFFFFVRETFKIIK